MISVISTQFHNFSGFGTEGEDTISQLFQKIKTMVSQSRWPERQALNKDCTNPSAVKVMFVSSRYGMG